MVKMGNIEFLTRLLLAVQFTFSEDAFKRWFELNVQQHPEGDQRLRCMIRFELTLQQQPEGDQWLHCMIRANIQIVIGGG